VSFGLGLLRRTYAASTTACASRQEPLQNIL
jgi:hypothetical protein